MFLVILEICDSGSTNRKKVSDFKFLNCSWSIVLVRYITILSFILESLSLDLCLKELIVDKGDISWNFNQNKKSDAVYKIIFYHKKTLNNQYIKNF